MVRPAHIASSVGLLLAAPTQPRDLYTREGAVQLCLVTASGTVSPLYHQLPTSDIALSVDRRELAYSDATYRIHLVGLPKGTDRLLGRGTLPRFSFDGRYLAFITSDTLPLPSPDERLVVYDRVMGTLTRAGPVVLPRGGAGFNGPITLYAWAPHANTLAWVPSPAKPGVAVVSAGQPATRRTLTIPGGNIASELAWSRDGRSLLYWRTAVSGHQAGLSVPHYSLIRWRLPNGPAETPVASVATAWIEGIAPAPEEAASGTLFASLLGAPNGNLNQVALYSRARPARTIRLPGEPRLVRFAAKGSQFVTIWTPPYGQGVASHAALADAATGRVQDLGPAVAAYWTVP